MRRKVGRRKQEMGNICNCRISLERIDGYSFPLVLCNEKNDREPAFKNERFAVVLGKQGFVSWFVESQPIWWLFMSEESNRDLPLYLYVLASLSQFIGGQFLRQWFSTGPEYRPWHIESGQRRVSKTMHRCYDTHVSLSDRWRRRRSIDSFRGSLSCVFLC